MGIWEMNTWQLIKAGGPIMFPIILCSWFAFGIIIEKLYYFFTIKTNILKLKSQVFDCIKENKVKEAIALCDANRSPVAKILRSGVLKFGASREEIKESMEDVSLFEIPKLEKHLGALVTIAHVSPLMGLLGTVTGIAGSFHTIQVRAASFNPITPSDLAGGIWEALITTVAGLLVAIPAYLTYNYFVSRVNNFILEMERAATELVNLLCHISETKNAHISD